MINLDDPPFVHANNMERKSYDDQASMEKILTLEDYIDEKLVIIKINSNTKTYYSMLSVVKNMKRSFVVKLLRKYTTN